MNQKKALFSLFIVVASELIGFGLIIPILPQIANKMSVSPLLLGILLASYSFAQFLAAPLLGSWSDKIGRKPVLLISKFGSVIAYLILAFSQNFWMFLVARLLDGFTGGNIAVARAYVIDVTTSKDRGKGMAIIGISFGLGFILGPAIGGLLYGGPQGHLPAALCAGALSFLAFILTLILLEEPKKHKIQNKKSILKDIQIIKKESVIAVLISYLIYMLMFSGFEATFSLFTEKLFFFTERDNSLLFVFVGLLALIIQGGIARRSINNLIPIICLGFISTMLGFLLISLSTTLLLLLVGLSILSLGIGLINSYLPAQLSKIVDEEKSGRIMGIYESIGSLSRIIGPLCATLFIMNYPRLSYQIFAIFLLIGFGVFIKLTRHEK